MKFCGNCGNPLSQLDEREEKKIVSILFADLKGFTSLSERMDAEDVKELMDNIFQKITEIIENNRGFVDKYLGDGVMALFGAPVAHEDDAERAVAAALEINEFISNYSKEKDLPLSIRIGINTGEVIAGLIGKGRARDYTVMGDAVNIAQRLQAEAPVGGILISENTKNLVEKSFALSPPIPLKLKGKSELISACKVEGKLLKPILYTSVFVNRREELNKLFRLYDACLLKQKPTFCLIIGELGIGKTRLIQEFEKEILTKAPIPYILKSQVSFWEKTSFYSLSELIKGIFNIENIRDYNQTRNLIESGLVELGYSSYELSIAEDFILFLLGLEKEKSSVFYLKQEDRLQSSFAIINKLLTCLSDLQPLIIIFDDIDYMDVASLEFIKFAYNNLNKNALFFILSSRRYFIEKEEFFKSIDNIINLNPLNKVDCQKLIKALTKKEQILKPLENYIIQHVEGNPLFLEEMLKSIKEYGGLPSKDIINTSERIHLLSIPPTLQAILSARIDMLPEKEKEILKTASIIGTIFSSELLEYLLERKVDKEINNLIQKEYIIPYKEKSFLGPSLFRFRHLLFQEIIYKSLLKKIKKPIHLKIARWLNNNPQVKDLNYLSYLAFHYEQSEINDKASEYYEAAGTLASESYSNEEAIKFYNKALEIVQPQSIPYKRILLKSAELLSRVGKQKEAFAAFEKLIEQTKDSEDIDNLMIRCRSLRNIASIALTQGEFSFALAKADEALATAQNYELIEEITHTCILLSSIHRYAADYDLSLKFSFQALPIMEKVKDFDGLSKAWYNIAVVYYKQSKYKEAWDAIKKSKKICVENNLKAFLPRIYEGMGAIQAQIGKYNKAFRYFYKASSSYRKIGHISGIASSFNNLGAILYYLGDWKGALNYQKKALLNAEIIGDKEGQALSLSNISILLKGIGNYKKALKIAHQALSMRKNIADKSGLSFSYNNIAALLIELNAPGKEIIPFLREAIDISTKIQLIEQKSYALALQAKFLLNQGSLSQAESSAMEAFKIAKEIKNNEKILESRFILFEISIEKKDYDNAKKLSYLTIKRAKRLKQKSFLLIAFYYRALLNFEIKKYDTALKLLEKIIIEAQQMRFLLLLLKSYILIYKIYSNNKQEDKAEGILSKLYDLKRELLKNIPIRYRRTFEAKYKW